MHYIVGPKLALKVMGEYLGGVPVTYFKLMKDYYIFLQLYVKIHILMKQDI